MKWARVKFQLQGRAHEGARGGDIPAELLRGPPQRSQSKAELREETNELVRQFLASGGKVKRDAQP